MGPTDFGVPGDVAPGSRCRTLVPTASGLHVVVAEGVSGVVVPATGGRPVCDVYRASLRCELEAGTRYRLEIHDDRDTSVSLVPWSAPGCEESTGRRTDRSRWTSTRPAGGAVCRELGYAAGDHVVVLEPTPMEGSTTQVVERRSRGCTHHRGLGCTLDASGARALRGSGPAEVPYDVAFASPQRTAGCQDLPLGAYGTVDAVQVGLPPGQIAQCFLVPPSTLDQAAFVAVEGSDPTASVRVLMGNDRDRRCSNVGRGGVVLGCLLPPGDDQLAAGRPSQVILFSDTPGSTWRVGLRGDPGSAPGCDDASTTRGGPASVGELSSFLDLDCWRLGSRTETGLLDLVAPDSGVRRHVLASGRDACAYSPGRCASGTADGVVVTRETAGPDVRRYSLLSWKYALDEAGECDTFADHDGPIGPVSGTLDLARPMRCLLLEDSGDSAFDVVAEGDVDLDGFAVCVPRPEGVSRCSGHGGNLDEGDVVLALRDGVTASDYRLSLRCATLPEVSCDVPDLENVVAPALGGTARVGGTVTADGGTWSPAQPAELRYRLLRDGVAWGAWQIDPGVALTPDMVGQRVAFQVQASNAGQWTAERVTSSSAQVRPGQAARNLVRPSIEGRPKVGRVLQAASGRWSPAPERFRYVWRTGRATVGHGATLRVTPGMRGRRVTVTVKAMSTGYDAGRATSRPLAVG
ncbi:hypothetical protein GCM10009623_14000 [Nocardioides aestuarii]